MSKQTPIKVGH